MAISGAWFFLDYFAWYQKFGYPFDPLSIKPTTELVAREKEIEILSENAVSGSIVILSGDAGLGKTSLLRAVEKNFEKDKGFRVKYVSLLDGFAEVKKACSPPGLFESALVWIGFLGKQKKILLVDECQLMQFHQAENLRNLFDCDNIHSIVLSSGEKNNLNLSLSFKKRVGEQLSLPRLSVGELKKMLKKRLNGVNPLSGETVDYIAKISDGNPRQFLMNCKKVLIKVHDFFNTENSVLPANAKEIIGSQQAAVAEEKPVDPVHLEHSLGKLTPLQTAILEQLNHGPASLKELSSLTGSSIGTIGKQISVLSLKAKKEYMARKGVTEPLIKKDKDSPITIYHLTETAKKLFGAQE
ncbi:MAG: hypothetical protein AABW85_04645 [archaeon]